MPRVVLAAVVLAAVTTFGPLGPRSASATADVYGPAPWCAVVDIGWGEVVWNCSYWSVEACVPHVLAGNRGVCSPNPDFRGPIPGLDTPPRRHRR